MSEAIPSPPADPGDRAPAVADPPPARGPRSTPDQPAGDPAPASAADEETRTSSGNRRRRGSRGGRNNRKPGDGEPAEDGAEAPPRPERARQPRVAAVAATSPEIPDLPDLPGQGKANPEAAARALVRRPKIGDTRPAPAGDAATAKPARKTLADKAGAPEATDGDEDGPGRKRRRRGGRGRGAGVVGKALGGTPEPEAPVELDEETLEKRRGRERKGKPVGRYQMCVHVRPEATQIAVLEGRSLIEHYVSRPSDDATQIHGNIYIGRVQNVLPGMEAAFVDIGTPKNAVLYRGDVQYDAEDVDSGGKGGGGSKDANMRIEQLLRPGQTVLCQVTKNPIGTKGARLTQEVSLAGRFVVLIPNSSTYGISKRLSDEERKRLRRILDEVRPPGQGLIVRTAAEGATPEELRRDVERLLRQWAQIEALPLFEQLHVHEQLHKALDRKVWLPSGGSLIIERTEALTVIDVNTGKNVGTSNLEETVFRNNLEAAEEVARQLRLRDIGGIIVIDFIDMEISQNRAEVVRVFRDALARDKTRTQVFDISELGLVEMTRKRVSEGLVEAFSLTCPTCAGRGIVFDETLL